MSKLQELKQQVNNLEELVKNIDNATDVTDVFNNYWPKLKDVLVFVKEMKITRRKADKKLQQAIDAGDKIYSTTSDPAKVSEDIAKLHDLLDSIDDKIDRVISILTFIDKFFKEDSKFDDLLDKTVEFLTKVSDAFDKLNEKLTV